MHYSRRSSVSPMWPVVGNEIASKRAEEQILTGTVSSCLLTSKPLSRYSRKGTRPFERSSARQHKTTGKMSAQASRNGTSSRPDVSSMRGQSLGAVLLAHLKSTEGAELYTMLLSLQASLAFNCSHVRNCIIMLPTLQSSLPIKLL